MFTGLIQHVGKAASVESTASGAVLRLDVRGWSHLPTPGESIAVNGCCLTLTSIEAGRGDSASPPHWRFDVIHQTLRMTTLGGLAPGDPVNLEHAATPGTLLGGHIVQGHVDGVGVARRVETGEPGEWRIRIVPPADLLDFIQPKGSIAVEGVSMTVADVGDDRFDIAAIPTTLEETTLGRIDYDAGEVRVNLEPDCLVKAVVHHLRRSKSAT